MNQPKYIKWFVEESTVTLEDGEPVSCYLLDYKLDEDICCELALHLRRHYESDEELKESLKERDLKQEEYLKEFIIPQKDDKFGPISRSSDFTEIMISDLIEFIHGYTVPRCKQHNRSGKTQSEHGTDILAYKFYKSCEEPTKEDELLAVEVKAGLSSDKYDPIKKAVSDSQKYDEVRHSHTLNYYRKKLKEINKKQADEIARFQQKSKNDYNITYIAAAVISRSKIDNDIIIGIKGSSLKLRKDNKIFLVHGEKLMNLVHEVYERCIK